MNAIYFRRRGPGIRGFLPGVISFAAVLTLVFGSAAHLPLHSAQSTEDPGAAFRRLAAELAGARRNGLPEGESKQERALAVLDSLVAPVLNSSPSPDLGGANRRLAGLVAHDPPLGENYRLVRLGATPPSFALVVNFGHGGPAAVRIYGRANGRYVLAARIDRFTNQEFFDSDIELVAVNPEEPVFVVVSGRSDDLSTGLFSVWRFDDAGLKSLWTSELLLHSSYQTGPSGFALTYCAQSQDDRPLECAKMSRDLYRLQSGAWTRIETTDLGPFRPPNN